MHWFIVAQVLGVLGLIVVFIAFQTKDKVKLLILDGIANLLMGLAYLAMGLYVIAAINFVAFGRDLAFAWLNNSRKKGEVHPVISVGLLFIFWAAFAAAIIMLRQSWIDWIILGLILIYVYSLWNKGNHLVRIVCLLLSVVFAYINATALNIMGVVVEGVYIVAITVFYIRLAFGKR